MYKLLLKKDRSYECFYNEKVNYDIPSNCIDLNLDLWRYLLKLLEIGSFKLKDDIVLENRVYTIKDINLFEKVISIPTDPPESQPTIDDRVAFLEKENADLMFTLMMNGVI